MNWLERIKERRAKDYRGWGGWGASIVGSDIDTLTSEVERLREEIVVSDKLLEMRNELLATIPECPDHGWNCVPHAIEWVKEALDG